MCFHWEGRVDKTTLLEKVLAFGLERLIRRAWLLIVWPLIE
jgi:hypothetical protein